MAWVRNNYWKNMLANGKKSKAIERNRKSLKKSDETKRVGNLESIERSLNRLEWAYWKDFELKRIEYISLLKIYPLNSYIKK